MRTHFNPTAAVRYRIERLKACSLPPKEHDKRYTKFSEVVGQFDSHIYSMLYYPEVCRFARVTRSSAPVAASPAPAQAESLYFVPPLNSQDYMLRMQTFFCKYLDATNAECPTTDAALTDDEPQSDDAR